MPDEEKIDSFRSVTAELKKQDSLLDSIGKRFANNNNLGKTALEVSKNKLSAEQRISSIQDSITQKTKALVELEDLRNINIREGGNIGNEIRREQLRYLKLIQEENKELARQESIVSNELVKQKIGWTGLTSKAKEFNQILKANPLLLAGAAAFLAVSYSVKKIWETFKQLDEAAADFRKSMGITRNDSKDIESTAKKIAIQYMALGVTAKEVYESYKSISEVFGSTLVASESLVKDISLFSAQLGVAAKTSSQFLKSMAMVSNSTASTQKDMLMIAQRMSAAAGVPLDDVMNDVASASQESYQFLSRNPLELLKSAVKAKELGTSLASAAKSSSTLLNFTENVKSEMEASVLLGKSMNLQKARELAYNRDITGLNQEIVRLAKEANFEQLDPFQQDAVAKALGKSAGEVAGMLESDREHSKVLKAMTTEQRKQYDELMKMDKSKIKNYAEIARKEVESMSNQKSIAAITLAWNAIFAKLASFVLPAIEGSLTFIAQILTGTASSSKYIVASIAAVGFVLAAIASKNYIGKIFGALGGKDGVIGRGIESVSKGLSGLSKNVSSTATNITKSIKSFMSLIGEFGVQLGKFVGGVAKGIGTGIEAIFKGISNGLKYMGKKEVFMGIMALGLLGISMIPFAYAMKTMTGLNWKSLGVAAVGLIAFTAAAFALGALMDTGAGAVIFASGAVAIAALGVALIPFAYAAQMAGKAMMDLGNGFKSIVSGMVELQSLTFTDTIIQLYKLTSAITDVSKAIKGIPDMKVEKLKSLIVPSTTDTKDTTVKDDKKKGESAEDILAAIKAGIEGLRNDMKNGMLTANVYIDSQKLDSAVGRRLAYTGTLT